MNTPRKIERNPYWNASNEIYRDTQPYVTPPLLLCDMYKLSHLASYPKGTRKVYSTWTARTNKYMPMSKEVVVFGIQGFIKKYLIDYFNDNFFNRNVDDIVAEYVDFRKHTLFEKDVYTQHIIDLHDLGYLPLEIRALDEGTLAPIQVPIITVENTHDDFYWLTNFIETIMSNEIWQPMTSASYSYAMRKMLNEYAMKTVGNTNEVAFSGHDFSMRGMSSLETSMLSGAGHLLSFVGTDNIPAIFYAKKYYNADYTKDLIGTSIPATEHSVMTALTPTDSDRNEYEAFKYLITEVFPSGLVSLVADSYDFWKVVSETLPALKPEIMNRDGKCVIRPDSGNPVDVLCGKEFEDLNKYEWIDNLESAKEFMSDYLYELENETRGHGQYGSDESEVKFKFQDKYYIIKVGFDYDRYDKQYYFICDTYIKKFAEYEPTAEDLGLIESLWNTFGGTISAKGYKVLDSHIGAIYGDSITYDNAKTIIEKLERKGFASNNVVFGMGSYGFQMRSRDSLGFAMKATYANIDGEGIMLMKDPKTDSKKKSQRGKVAVVKGESGLIHMIDGLGGSDEDTKFINENSLLTPVFKNGQLVKEVSFLDIRDKLNN